MIGESHVWRAITVFVVALAVLVGCNGDAPSSRVDASAGDVPTGNPLLIDDRFTPREWESIRGMALPSSLPPDSTNRYADDPRAASLGRLIFHDMGFSRGNDVACTTCHQADRLFTDGTAVAVAQDPPQRGRRNTPTILYAAWGRWKLLDGRADLLWAQPVLALENAREHATTRLNVAHRVASVYRAQYEPVFGSLPPLEDGARFPAFGRPGDPTWEAMSAADQMAANRVMANVGKAVEAFERSLVPAPSAFDRYAAGDFNAMSAQQRDGLRSFVTRRCNDCHLGPSFSDQIFHALRVPDDTQAGPDRGRLEAFDVLRDNVFGARGPFSDDPTALPPPESASPELLGRFRTPTLRGVAVTAPYGHAGTLATLEDAIRLHASGGLPASDTRAQGTVDTALVTFEPRPGEVDALVAFLGALTPGSTGDHPPDGDGGIDASQGDVGPGIDASPDAPLDVVADGGATDVRAMPIDVCPPEPTTPDHLGQPLNPAGHVRWCWPGEAHCFCDTDGDCYDEPGYVPCSGPRDAGPDAAPDVPVVDVVVDATPASAGQWSAPLEWPIFPAHLTVLPDGRVLTFSTQAGGRDATIWNPATGAFTAVPTARTNLGCGGHAFMPDGRLMVTGGETPSGDHFGSPQTNIFNFATGAWSAAEDMNSGRWYPTSTTLANGDMLVTAGDISPGGRNLVPQVWSSGAGWRSLTEARLNLSTYPFMFLAPDGRVFCGGPEQGSQILSTAVTARGAGAWTMVGPTIVSDHNEGSAVMYDDGQVLLVGGHDPPTSVVETIDLRDARPAWRRTGSLNAPRRQINATLMPDGNVLVTGGSASPGYNDLAGALLSAEAWDPATGVWTTLASAHHTRLYHSTAALLPDGRIIAGGGRLEMPAGNENQLDVEFFSPPYLFRGARPVVTAAPASVAYGATFSVATPDAASITRVTWLRLGAVTHGFDQNQRINRLRFVTASAGLTVTAPTDHNLAPPGHYMLFALNGRGVPSIARIVQLR